MPLLFLARASKYFRLSPAELCRFRIHILPPRDMPIRLHISLHISKESRYLYRDCGNMLSYWVGTSVSLRL